MQCTWLKELQWRIGNNCYRLVVPLMTLPNYRYSEILCLQNGWVISESYLVIISHQLKGGKNQPKQKCSPYFHLFSFCLHLLLRVLRTSQRRQCSSTLLSDKPNAVSFLLHWIWDPLTFHLKGLDCVLSFRQKRETIPR
jgi:hypothetical protein